MNYYAVDLYLMDRVYVFVCLHVHVGVCVYAIHVFRLDCVWEVN